MSVLLVVGSLVIKIPDSTEEPNVIKTSPYCSST